MAPDGGQAMNPAEAKRHLMARRAAKELKDGMYCNLGIGVPTLAANYIPKGIVLDFFFESSYSFFDALKVSMLRYKVRTVYLELVLSPTQDRRVQI